ncbi:MAG: hypothetical protein EOO06_00125 [Chitinophagaceae bacterium]|nr:MAG: hypothetical protein EOO06_00125 [Chitinophagaceae bacterium]
MRSSTMLKKLLQSNTVTLSMNDGQITVDVANNNSGNYKTVTATTVSNGYKKAYNAVLKVAIDRDLNF